METMASPVAQDRVGRPAEPDEAQNLATLLPIGPEQKARIRILVVDDEHTLRESCATVLRQEGYDLTVCGRGQEAIDLLKRRAFDIVLADLYMPQVGGLALLRAALATNRDTLFVVMTGNPSVDSSVEALRQGAFDYLPKPFSATHLMILIGRAVHTLFVARETREQQEELERRHVHSDKITLLGTAPALQPPVRGRELRSAPRRAARVGDVRAPEGRVHRCRAGQTRSARGRERRHAVPGRVDRNVEADPGQAPAGHPGRRGAPGRQRDNRRRRERPVHRRDERRSRSGREGRRAAGGPVLPAARGADPGAAAARATGGHSAPRRVLPLDLLDPASQQGGAVPEDDRYGAPRPVRVPLARQRARAAERD